MNFAELDVVILAYAALTAVEGRVTVPLVYPFMVWIVVPPTDMLSTS